MHLCRFFVVVFFVVAVHHSSDAQAINLSDSLRHVLSHPPVFTAKFDTRNSFITGKSAKIQGIKVGFSFRKTLTIGFGYSWLRTDFPQLLKLNDNVYQAEIKLRYMGPYLEYSFYKKGPWEATVPVQLGFGRSYLQYRENGKKRSANSSAVVLYEPSMTVEYKIRNMIGVGGGVGYRIMLKNNREIDQQFTSPFYVIRFRLIFDELYQQVKRLQAKRK